MTIQIKVYINAEIVQTFFWGGGSQEIMIKTCNINLLFIILGYRNTFNNNQKGEDAT